MLDIQIIRENPDLVRKASADKKDPAEVDRILALDEKRRLLIKETETLKSDRNSASKEVARLKKQKGDASALIAEMKRVSDRIKELDGQLAGLEGELRELMIRVPNLPHSSVKHGESARDNEILSEWGEGPAFGFEPLDHLQLASRLDIIDFPRGAKIAGTGFGVYKGMGALLERALINFMLDTHTRANGYREVFPPFLANRESAFGTAQLPKAADQMYLIGDDNLFCIPTAEVPVTNLHRDEILDGAVLPIRYCAYSACFRREAGSWGKDTKGFLRVHQFNKVELVKFTRAENSYEELECLTRDAEGILEALNLRYRRVGLCDADLSFGSAKTYDLEVWAPGERAWLEASSCSNFEDFQARRMNLRYRPEGGGKPVFAHTLNGSGVATSRVIVALLETYQTREGNVRVPDVLRPYMHGSEEICRS
ncbi:MAG: serine--tRNA ligase [Chitinivibrionales bacterium]|nr:serine--tRNA ligase [Chitinivibrionales bacterium]MBD3396835.1 serine--tRNA ligase [Chitinivibrionales bacterium]